MYRLAGNLHVVEAESDDPGRGGIGRLLVGGGVRVLVRVKLHGHNKRRCLCFRKKKKKKEIMKKNQDFNCVAFSYMRLICIN